MRRASRASGAPLLALYDMGVRMAIQRMALSQCSWSRLVAISGAKRVVMDGTSVVGGDRMAGAGCVTLREPRDSVSKNR